MDIKIYLQGFYYLFVLFLVEWKKTTIVISNRREMVNWLWHICPMEFLSVLKEYPVKMALRHRWLKHHFQHHPPVVSWLLWLWSSSCSPTHESSSRWANWLSLCHLSVRQWSSWILVLPGPALALVAILWSKPIDGESLSFSLYCFQSSFQIDKNKSICKKKKHIKCKVKLFTNVEIEAIQIDINTWAC